MGRIRKIKNAHTLIRQYSHFIHQPQVHYFTNHHPLEIEIGSGKGIFLITKALNNPAINYIGIERDPTIVLKALKKINSLNTPLNNLLLINDNATNLNKWFVQDSIQIIYLNFSDPWPKTRHEKHRLTNQVFLNLYYNLLRNHGLIEFKTDNLSFYEYSLLSFDSFGKFTKEFSTINLYQNLCDLKDNVQTEYEQKFINQNVTIKKIIWKKN